MHNVPMSSKAAPLTLGAQPCTGTAAGVGIAASINRPTSSGKTSPKLIETSSAVTASRKRPRHGAT